MTEKRTSLLIMAAGLGSRFGEGIKQLAGIGPNGEIIMEYSIHDAIEAGFNKIIFIIRKDIEKDFLDIINRRVGPYCRAHGIDTAYFHQEMDDIPRDIEMPVGRLKPWGTGHAVYAARLDLNDPFAVINADDYYGKEAFVKVHDFLVSNDDNRCCCMAGFSIGNTLSDNGTVTRGICKTDADGFLTNIDETKNIRSEGGLVKVDDRIISPGTPVSMNFWGFMPGYKDMLTAGFTKFLKNEKTDLSKDEFLLPIHIGQLLSEDFVKVKVLPVKDKWFGVTYKEDTQTVVDGFKAMIEEGKYREDLFSDL